MSDFHLKLTPEQIFKLRQALPTLAPEKKKRALELLAQYDTYIKQSIGKMSFMDFIKHVYPGYMIGPHHAKLAQIFEDIAAGKKKRVIVQD